MKRSIQTAVLSILMIAGFAGFSFGQTADQMKDPSFGEEDMHPVEHPESKHQPGEVSIEEMEVPYTVEYADNPEQEEKPQLGYPSVEILVNHAGVGDGAPQKAVFYFEDGGISTAEGVLFAEISGKSGEVFLERLKKLRTDSRVSSAVFNDDFSQLEVNAPSLEFPDIMELIREVTESE